MKLDIGCGNKCKEGFDGVDKNPYQQKYRFDLEGYWELEDNSVDEVFSSHCLEHIKNINYFMRELWRVMKPEAIVTIIVPYYKWEGAFRDPSHVRFFTEHTFKYFNKDYANQINYDMEYDFDFQIIDIDIVFGREIKCKLKPIKK